MNQSTPESTQELIANCYPLVPESIMTPSRCELSDIELQIIAGNLPEHLHGHVFVVGPVGSVNSGDFPDPDGTSILDGDGMVYRLDFNQPGKVKLKTKLLKPPCYYADKATRPGTKYAKYQFRNHGISRFTISLGLRNELNTAFLPIPSSGNGNDRLLVTYDAGRPYEIDTETLEVVTPIGANQEWRSETSLKLPFLPILSTAHPAFDAYTKEMFTVNYGRSAGNFLESIPFIYEIDELPEVIDELLEAIAQLISAQDFIKDWLRLFWRFSQDISQFYLSLIAQVTKLEIDDFLYLIRWNGVSELERWKLVNADGTPIKINQSIHQIAVSQDYVVLMDTAFTTGIEQVLNKPFPSSQGTERLLRELLSRPSSPDSSIYIVRRTDLKAGQKPACSQLEVTVVARKVVIPLEAAHFLVDYQNPRGEITLHVAHISAADVSEWLREYDVSAYKSHDPVPNRLYGMQQNEMDISRLGRYVIDSESGRILQSKVIYDSQCTWFVALYAYRDRLPTGMPPKQLTDIYWVSLGLWKELTTKFIYDLYKDYKYRAVPLPEMLRLADQGIPACLFRLHTSPESMAIADCYQFPSGYIASSPQFIPLNEQEESQTNGYIICTVCAPNNHEVWIFHAEHLAQGPLCKLTHPSFKFGLTIHTAWLPKIAPRTATYQVPVRQDYQTLVKQKSPEIQELFEDHVYPHFK